MVGHTGTSEVRRQRWESQKLKSILGYKVSLRLSWVTQDLVSKLEQKQNKNSKARKAGKSMMSHWPQPSQLLSQTVGVLEAPRSWPSRLVFTQQLHEG